MVRAIVLAAIITLVAIYSLETFGKTLGNPSIAEPAITKHTKNLDDDNRSAARSHHRGGRSPSGDSEDSGDIDSSGGGDSRGHHQSSSAGTASGGYGVRIGPDGRKNRATRFSESQISQLESTFADKRYLSPLECKNLADSVDLEEKQVRIWFKNRRVKTATYRMKFFTESQISQLESTFADKQYLSPLGRKNLADSLDVEEEQVRIWFKNRRARTGTSRRRKILTESQHSQLQRAVDGENETSSSDRASSAAPSDPAELQVQRRFDNCRREEPPSATFNPVLMELEWQINLLRNMLHHNAATLLGQSGNGNGDPVASSVASSSRSVVSPHSVGDGTFDRSVPTDGPGMFHWHHPQHQYGHPSHVTSRHHEYPETRSPPSSPPCSQPRRDSSE